MASFLDDLRAMSRGARWGHRRIVPASADGHRGPEEERQISSAWARSAAARRARAAFLASVVKPVVYAQTDPRIHGLDNLDGVRGPVLFVSNHASHLDATLLLCSLPKRWRNATAVGAASDYFFDVWYRSIATALVYNAFPIDRTSGRRTVKEARQLIREGWSLVIFPEGTRSHDGWIHPFHRLPASLCVGTRIPAVPVALRGTFAAMPRGRAWPAPGKTPISVRYGAPMHPADGEDARAFSARLYQEVSRLWDEDTTDWYSSLRRAAQDRTPEPTGPQGARWRRVWEGSRPPERERRKGAWSSN